MKTVSDIAAFLKRHPMKALRMMQLGNGKFEVFVEGVEDYPVSQYLDDALDNLQESMRRRANGMQSVREAESATDTAPGTGTFANAGQPKSLSLAMLKAALHTMKGTAPPPIKCPSCGNDPISANWNSSVASFTCCVYWHVNPVRGQRLRVIGQPAEYEWTGTRFVQVSP